MSIYDEIFGNDNLTEDEKVQSFLEMVSDASRSPDWEGDSMPNIPQIRRYLRATEILKKLFVNSKEAEVINDGLEPYQESSGGSVYVWSGGNQNISSMVFENNKATLLVSEFLSLIDSITITAERSQNPKHPGFVIAIYWTVLDTMIGNS